MKLSDTLGKSITDFCQNGFSDPDDNHCAHFVCHVLSLDVGYSCRTHTGGKRPSACIRVQELFSVCPQVGNWGDTPQGTCLVFVTDRANVDLADHVMRNVPKKHVGIFSDGVIYNYSNKQDIVVRQPPEAFLERFKNTYGGNQALYFGTLPPEAKVPDPEQVMPATFPLAHIQPALVGPAPAIRKVQATPTRLDYFATLGGQPEYYVGRDTKFGSLRGLAQPSSTLYGPRYDISDFTDDYGPVAAILGIIAAGESAGYFNRLNSYDRAAFTFGFFQLAAHTPRDNLILLMRRAVVEHGPFQALFPDLQVVNGKLHRAVGTHMVSLENEYPRPSKPTEMNLKDFMTYLNADGSQVDDAELNAAARLIHLANTDGAFNRLQVNLAAQILMRRMRYVYSEMYDLNGVSDLVCAAIADIHHQARGGKQQVKDSLSGANTVKGKLELLCNIGAKDYPERCLALKSALMQAQSDGYLGKSVFDKASGLFRPSAGWED
ncbi:hypothetical protein OS670_21350 (plasmid) [Pseudomonadaceae bacterium T75]|uniref:hypothetical protein n=1 Tax=Stutzerimonas kunmingensis TaxID=1211807 RepID=UPI000F79B1DF|nr:hypothetical protein [Stutzerimonas kunmingensis]WAD28840.1 hypothetical protein OS670_21350 [Pseudomonadaceae bacterium T75]